MVFLDFLIIFLFFGGFRQGPARFGPPLKLGGVFFDPLFSAGQSFFGTPARFAISSWHLTTYLSIICSMLGYY